jgi:uncharacterized protein
MSASSQRIAVIGTGIGGLTAAWLLARRHAVTLYEQHAKPGMGVFAVDYASRGKHTRIDIPTRVFCRGYYPQLLALLDTLGVQLHATDHSAAFADHRGEMRFHYGKLRLLGRDWDYLKHFDHATLGIALEARRFFREARRAMARPETLADQTLADYLAAGGYDERFTRDVLVPTLSVICTCDYAGVLAYPADLLLGYLVSGVMQQGVLRAELGVGDIVDRLVRGMDQVCGVAVTRVERSGSTWTVGTADGQSREYARVVMATQAQQAAAVLGADSEYTPLLSAVPFEASEMRVHTEPALLPRSRLPLSPVTYHLPHNGVRPEVTVDLTQAVPTYRGQAPVFQTWNPVRAVDRDRVLATARFTRPRVTRESRRAMQAMRRMQEEGAGDLLFCGAYLADRVPLLEAAVESSVRVATRLGAPPHWDTPP